MKFTELATTIAITEIAGKPTRDAGANTIARIGHALAHHVNESKLLHPNTEHLYTHGNNWATIHPDQAAHLLDRIQYIEDDMNHKRL